MRLARMISFIERQFMGIHRFFWNRCKMFDETTMLIKQARKVGMVKQACCRLPGLISHGLCLLVGYGMWKHNDSMEDTIVTVRTQEITIYDIQS